MLDEGISAVRGLDSAYRYCDPTRHIIGASGHVSGHARTSRENPAPPFTRLATMMRRLLICAAILAVSGCAPIEHTQALVEPTGKVQTVPVGGAIASVAKQKSSPNAFGAADIYGRKVDTGFTKIVYHGLVRDGGIVLRQTDVDVHSNASVFTRMPSMYTASSSESVHGHASGGHASCFARLWLAARPSLSHRTPKPMRCSPRM